MTEQNSTIKLTPRQQRGILGLLSTGTITEAAALAKVNRTALHRWLRDPNFYVELEAERKRMADGLRDKITVAAGKAIDELQKILERGEDDRKIKAAAVILQPLTATFNSMVMQTVQNTNSGTIANQANTYITTDAEQLEFLLRATAAGNGIDYDSMGVPNAQQLRMETPLACTFRQAVRTMPELARLVRECAASVP